MTAKRLRSSVFPARPGGSGALLWFLRFVFEAIAASSSEREVAALGGTSPLELMMGKQTHAEKRAERKRIVRNKHCVMAGRALPFPLVQVLVNLVKRDSKTAGSRVDPPASKAQKVGNLFQRNGLLKILKSY